MKPGYLYIFENELMPGVLKIGRTSRRPEQRVRELFTTGVPIPFTIRFAVEVDDPAAVEFEVHQALDQFRVNSNREFFRIHLPYAIEAIETILYGYSYSSEIHQTNLEFMTGEVEWEVW